MEKTYVTHDWATAIALRIKKIPLLEVRKVSGRFVEFIFGASPERCEEIKRQYWERQPETVPLRDVLDEIKYLKGVIHEELER